MLDRPRRNDFLNTVSVQSIRSGIMYLFHSFERRKYIQSFRFHQMSFICVYFRCTKFLSVIPRLYVRKSVVSQILRTGRLYATILVSHLAKSVTVIVIGRVLELFVPIEGLSLGTYTTLFSLGTYTTLFSSLFFRVFTYLVTSVYFWHYTFYHVFCIIFLIYNETVYYTTVSWWRTVGLQQGRKSESQRAYWETNIWRVNHEWMTKNNEGTSPEKIGVAH